MCRWSRAVASGREAQSDNKTRAGEPFDRLTALGPSALSSGPKGKVEVLRVAQGVGFEAR